MSRVIISVASYNNEAEVIEYGRQLSAQSYIDNIVYLVTANSEKNYNYLEEELKSLAVETHLYNPSKNLGYLNGCLYGIKQFSRTREDDIYIISNTDLEICSTGFIMQIERIMKDKDIYCLGPSIRLKTGKYQNPFLNERPSPRKVLMWRLLQGNPFSLRVYSELSRVKRRSKDNYEKKESANVYAVHGSFFALSSACVKSLLQTPNDIFMFGEEILIAEVAREQNAIVYYTKELEIVHNENSTTGITNATIKAKWYRQSFDYIYKTYFRMNK